MSQSYRFLSAEELTNGAEPSEAWTRLHRILEIDRPHLISPIMLRRGQDWSGLAYQAVGREYDPRLDETSQI